MDAKELTDVLFFCFPEKILSRFYNRALLYHLRQEKDMLKESKSQSLELIKRLEQHVGYLTDARKEDKNRIANLEKELLNCSQEIDYLQDQLNAKNCELDSLADHVQSLELRLVDSEVLHGMVGLLEGELKKSRSECFILMQELDNKEMELQASNLCVEKMEETVSSMALESQCEIESMKLDMISLEQSCFEAKKIKEEAVQEKSTLTKLIQDLEIQFQDAQEAILCLKKENKELREKLAFSGRNVRIVCQKMQQWMEKHDIRRLDTHQCLNKPDSEPTTSKEACTCGEGLSCLLAKLAPAESDSKAQTEGMLPQIQDYENLVKQLKVRFREELRMEKLKSKEEAEDLAQEMAELRFQITGLLEEEYKRRACIEQASLQRIAQLEAQVSNERRKSVSVVSNRRE